MIPGWGTVAGVVARIVDTLWPTKKEAMVETLQKLEVEYQRALDGNQDTRAAIIHKQMVELRKKVGYASD